MKYGKNEKFDGSLEQYSVVREHVEAVYERLQSCKECDLMWVEGTQTDPEDSIGHRVFLWFCTDFDIDPDYGPDYGMTMCANTFELLNKYEAILEAFGVR